MEHGAGAYTLSAKRLSNVRRKQTAGLSEYGLAPTNARYGGSVLEKMQSATGRAGAAIEINGSDRDSSVPRPLRQNKSVLDRHSSVDNRRMSLPRNSSV